MKATIQPFENLKHRDAVVELWDGVFDYKAPHNQPELVIDKKVTFGDGLFFVALLDQKVIGTIMAGYDGHRGWIYSMAVSPDYRKQGIGNELLSFTEKKLFKMGCLKINLQIMAHNKEVEGFYSLNGYHTERRISMGKRLYGDPGT